MVAVRRRPLLAFAIGLVLLTVLVAACAKSEEAAAPKPATQAQPAAASAAAPTPAPAAPTAAPAPAAAPAAPPVSAPAPSAQPPPTPAAPASAFPKPSGKGAQEFGWGEIKRFPAEKLSLWTRAVYGGEITGQSPFAPSALDPLKFLTLSRTHNFGVLLTLDNGRCSMVGRTDFSTCPGARNNPFKTSIIPMIIAKWEQPDPKTYILTVRDGVLWPNRPDVMSRVDRAVTAEDIKWWFDIQKKEGVLSANLLLVKEVTAVDKRTLRIDFTEPYADFLFMLADFGVGLFPRECYEQKGCLGSMKVVSPGPMLPEAEEPRVRQTWLKNPEFYLKGLPYHDRYVLLNVTDPAAQKAAFVTGKWYGYRANAPEEVQSVLKQVPDAQVHSLFSPGSIAHYRPQIKAPYPMSDVRVRRALSLAIDRRALWQLANGGFNFMGLELPWEWLGIAEPFTPEEAGQWNRYDPEQAKKLLADAGYSNGFSVSVEASSSGTIYTPAWDTSVKEMWRKIGVTLNIKTLDSIAITGNRASGSWDGFTGTVCWQPTCAGNTVDGYYLQLVSYSPQNLQKLNDPKIDGLYARQRSELDPAKRRAVHWELQQYLWDMQYALVMGVASTYMMVPAWEMNFQVHQYSFWTSVTTAGGWLSMHDIARYRK